MFFFPVIIWAVSRGMVLTVRIRLSIENNFTQFKVEKEITKHEVEIEKREA